MATGFRGWWIVAVAFLAEFAALGLSLITYPLFAQPIQEEFAVSMLQFNLALTPFSIVMTLSGPVVGPMLDHRSIRGIMVVGGVLLSASLALMSVATSPGQLGAVFGTGVALSVTLLGPLPAMTVVAKWFERQRGRAIGIVSLGPLAAGLLLPPVGGALIESVGWRGTLRWFSAGSLLIVPLVWLVIRNRPEDVGQRSDGGVVGGMEHVPASGSVLWSARTLVGARAFWAIALALGLIFGFLQAWTPNLGKFAHDLGYGVQQQAWLLMAAGALGIPGTVLCGWLAERRDPRTLIWLAIAIQIAAFGLMRTGTELAVLIAASAAVGGAAGGLTPLYAALLARVFGPASFGTAMGAAGLVMLPFAAVAPPLLGQLRDATGSYDLALVIMIGAFAVGAMILGLLPARPAAVPVASRVE